MNDTKSNGTVVAASAIGVLGILGVGTALLLVFAGPASAHHAATPTPSPTPSSSSSSSAANHSVTPPPPSPSNVPVAPSASVEMLQRDLGQLNYYEGPVNGVMTAQTIQSIKYLQRDAHLPQTGEINQATSQALQRMLTDGNNQMAG
jgi:peptidoglycan hydrolase-like protein with peptidoglycan-binding domain